MCRLLGYQGRARALRRELLDEPNSMLRQSQCDRDMCQPNDDGWGFGFESDGRLEIVKRPCAPAGDAAFARMAGTTFHRVMLHIRRASVGGASAENTHPWSYDNQIIFAHNGSVYGFDSVRDEAMASLPVAWRRQISGTTDSEFAMVTFIRFLGTVSNEVESYRRAFSQTVADMRRWSEKAGADRLPKLNFMILTRHLLMATRVVHSLGYYVTDDGVVITSESLRDGDGWTPLKDETVMAVRPDATWDVWPL